MCEVVAHVVAAEGLHCHGIVAENARRARCGCRRLGGHDGADEHAVIPIAGLVDKGRGGRAAAAEDDRVKRNAVLGVERLRKAGAVHGRRGEAGVGMCRFHAGIGRPLIAQPVDEVLGRGFGQPFPPHGVVRGVDCNVGEDGVLSRCGKRVGVALLVRAGRDAEEAVLGVDRPQSAVFADADPRDVVADALHLVTLFKVVFGGNEHGKVGLAAGGRERRRNVLLGAVGIGHAQNEHVLRHPALVLAEEGSDAQREALFAEQHVSAVCGVDGDDGIVLGEVHDIALLGIDVALAVQTFDEVAVLAQNVVAVKPDAGHDRHV